MSKGMRIRLVIVMTIAAALSGCGQSGTYDKTQYVLNPTRSVDPVTASGPAVLEVRRFIIDSAFNSKGIVYRIGDLQYEADFYHEFLASPVAMIKEAARNWFAQSGLFERVADAGSYIEPAYALEANVTALYGDVRDENNQRAVVELRAFLLKVKGSRDPVLVHSKTYAATSPIETQDCDALVAAFNRCLQTILTDLEKDLAARLQVATTGIFRHANEETRTRSVPRLAHSRANGSSRRFSTH